MHEHIARLLAMLFAYSFALACDAATAPGQFQSTIVPFTFEDNRIFVKCTIDGQGPFAFVVDTGSDGTTIDRAVAQRLQLHTKPAGSTGGAGNHAVSFSMAVIGSIDIGAAHAENQKATVLDLSQIRKGIGLPSLDGIVGYSILKHYAVEVDMDRHVLTLSRTPLHVPEGARAVPFTLASSFIFVPGRIAGDSGTILIDTGDRSSLTLFGPFAAKHQIYGRFGGVQNALTGFGVGGPVFGDVFSLPQFDILGARLTNVTTRASRQTGGFFASNAASGSIGGGVLRRFNIVYDYPHRTLYVWKSSSFALPDGYDRAGLWIAQRDDRAYIASVLPGGPAAKAGLQQGDEILTINGKPVGTQDILNLRASLSSSPPGTSLRLVSESHGKKSSHDIVLKQLV